MALSSCSFNYNKSNVSAAASSGSYSNLRTYNSTCGLNFDGNSIPAPAISSIRSGYYMVPKYGGITYDALTSRDGRCTNGSGYFGIETAYGENSGAPCNQAYIQSGCGNPEPLGDNYWRCDGEDGSGSCVPSTRDFYDSHKKGGKVWRGNPVECMNTCGSAAPARRR